MTRATVINVNIIRANFGDITKFILVQLAVLGVPRCGTCTTADNQSLKKCDTTLPSWCADSAIST